MSVLQYSVLALSAALNGPLLFTLIVVELTVGGTVSVTVIFSRIPFTIDIVTFSLQTVELSIVELSIIELHTVAPP